MRKLLLLLLSLLLLLFRFTGTALAAESARADVPVVIEGGGTAYMISEVNSPLPTAYSIRIDNGRTGHFYIDFTRAGEFHYTVKADFSESGKDRPAENTFRVTVTVYERENGKLYATTTIYASDWANKETIVQFDKPKQPPTTPDTPTSPSTPETPTTPGTPETPTTPGTPETPTTPSTPETPTTPGTSDTPGTPTTPGTPGTPDTPTTPGTPGKPSAPKLSSSTPETIRKPSRTPRTGDESNLTRYLTAAIASSFGLFLLALLYTVNTNRLVKDEKTYSYYI